MYIVLARKYRPQTFNDLRGQEVLVKTLKNAIENQRLGHAFLLTGTRGVGKTTTARIIAKAINCKNKPEHDKINPCNECNNCLSITNDRHPDVIEMDAASKTSVDDIRSIIENVNYAPILGDYKVYIIDEVHMLSKSAFNALLKTLEEPPKHAIFIFATTENHKIPITIISRCIRFDLQNISEEILISFLKEICEKENIEFEDKAIELLATAAMGSARDSLSLLDRAINYCLLDNAQIKIQENSVRNLLGLSDQSHILDLLQFIMNENSKEALELFRKIYMQGGNASMVLNALSELIHFASCLKIDENFNNKNYSENFKSELLSIIQNITIAHLTRYWQIILKGFTEINNAKNIFHATEMIIIRLCYISNMPTPYSLIKDIKLEQQKSSYNISEKQPINIDIKKTKPSYNIENFDDVINLCKEKGEILIYYNLLDNVNLVSFAPLEIHLKVNHKAPRDLSIKLSQILSNATSKQWKIILVEEAANTSNTLIEQNKKEIENIRNEIVQSDEIKKLLESFPDAKITKIDINN